MEAKKQVWTEEDKYWAIGGGAVALVGGIYWYLQNKKASETAAVDGADKTYIDSAETTVAIGSGSSSNQQSSNTGTATTPVSSTRQPDPIRYSVGQEMMANSFAKTKAYEAKKMANGQYMSSGVVAANFNRGDLIGKIIWVGQLADGTFRYVIERKGLLANQIYWIADYRVILPTNNSKGISTTQSTTTSSLNVSLLLKKGSKGLEVRELQKRLGFTGSNVDGDFGTNTLTALQKQKGVSQITLAAFATTNLSTLNFNLMLKKGSKGLEVKELQKRLGFTGSNVDGDFGTKTESALFAMKAVKQTTLNQFSYV